MPASPEVVAVPGAGAMATFAATLDRSYDRIADWAERQSLAPASAAGISLIFGICAAAWLTAGTRTGNLYGAIALAAGYLVALGSREFLSPAQFQPADLAAAEVAGASIPAGLVAGTGAARSGWLAMLGTRLSEYAVYVGLAVGAAAGGWHGVWPLTIAVLGLAAVCDTMTVCSSAGRPAPAPGRFAPGRPPSKGAGVDDTIPDVPAWEGTAPDVALTGGAAPPASAAPTPPHDELPRPGDPGHDGEPEQLRVGGMVGRVLLTALGMPPGGRVLLIALAAPVFGAQPTLVALFDWGIIGVGYGIGSRTAARRRDRKADHAHRDDPDAAGARAEPGGLAILLQPARPAEIAGPPEPQREDPQLPVLRIAPSPSGTVPEPVGNVLDSVADLPVPELADLPVPEVADLPVPELAGPDRAAPEVADLPVPELAGPDRAAPDPAAADLGAPPAAAGDSDPGRAAYASELTVTAAFENGAFAGEPSIGATFGLAYTDETGAAQHVADPTRPIPGGPGGRQSPVGEPQAGRPSLGRLFGGRDGSSGRGAGAAGPDDDAVYDWADDGWPDGGSLEDQGSGQPADASGASTPVIRRPDSPRPGPPRPDPPRPGPRGSGAPRPGPRGPGARRPPGRTAEAGAAGRGGATDAELADQDEWDAELAAEPQLPGDAEPGGQARLADHPPQTDYPTLAERLGLGRSPEPSDAADAGADPAGTAADAGADPAGTAEYADRPAGSAAAALAGQPGAPEAPGAAWPAAGAGPPGSAAVLRNRDDGTLARWFGSLVRGQLVPLPPALLALAAVAMLAHLGLRDLPGLLILAPALVMLVAAPGASHPHDGRFDWLAPAVLQGAQYVYIAALGVAAGVPAPITFLLCAAVALHYADLGSAGSPILLGVRRAGSPQVARRRRRPAGGGTAARPGRPRRTFQQRLGQTRPGQQTARAGTKPGRPQPGAQRPPATELGMWMGWEGRMIAVGLGAAMGVAMFAYLALAGYLSWLVCCKVRASYLGLREGDVQ